MITFNSNFGMDKTRATLQASGKELIEIKLLRMCVRGEAIILAFSLRYFTGIWSAAIEQSDFMVVNIVIISLWVTGRRLNEQVRCSSGRELMRSKDNSNKFASDPSKRFDVELKCLFSASGSTLIGWGLGYKVRCMMFHGSLGLLDDRALLKKSTFNWLNLSLNLVAHLPKFIPNAC